METGCDETFFNFPYCNCYSDFAVCTDKGSRTWRRMPKRFSSRAMLPYGSPVRDCTLSLEAISKTVRRVRGRQAPQYQADEAGCPETTAAAEIFFQIVPALRYTSGLNNPAWLTCSLKVGLRRSGGKLVSLPVPEVAASFQRLSHLV